MKGKCIVCETDNEGFPVVEDAIILAIRAIKKKLNMAKGNTLIVCSGCVEQYRKKRAEFEKALVQHGLIAAFLLVLLVLVPPLLGGTFNLAGIGMGILLAVLMLAFSIFRYYPAADLTGYVPAPPAQASLQPQPTQPQPAQAKPVSTLQSLLPFQAAKKPPLAQQREPAHKQPAAKKTAGAKTQTHKKK
ncbi:hypothetical protein J4441_05830 [Candidatus Micrarchaeota archaeon]|nr:hypothetical protein [Candidatus Micrarchaeota archaeon]